VTALRSTMTALITVALAVTLSAQNPAPAPLNPEQPAPGSAPPARGAKAPAIPLEVQIVLARYQGEKRVSSMPYVLAVNANGSPASLNMGAEVAIPSSTFAPNDPSKPQPFVSFNYRPIGTSIVSGAVTTAEEGRFELNISVDDSSVYLKEDSAAGSPAAVSNMPAFRSFKSRNTLLLRDGQTRQYTAATDRVSGETIRIDVTLKVVK
jgi:hypothetical protein